MNLLRYLRNAARGLFRKEQMDGQLDHELLACVEMLTEERVAAGMSPAEARRSALAEFGGVEQVKQAVRDGRPAALVASLAQDLAYGGRRLLRSPGFTVAVLATLALAIGANTAVFSLVNALLLRSLPYPEPERMGTIFQRDSGTKPYDGRQDIDGAMWEQLRDQVPSLLGAVASPISPGANLRAGQSALYVHASRVSAQYFDVLGIHPMLGRWFTEEEDRPHGPEAVVLSYGLWKTVFHGDRGLVGRAVELKGQKHTVVGVLPAGAMTPVNADVYTPLQPSRDGEGAGTNFDVVVRLRRGATWQQANAELNRAWADSIRRFAKDNGIKGTVEFYAVPLQKGATAELRPKALGLFLASGVLLAIACANLASLTLVRLAGMRPEIATRLALGASLWRVQRQVWMETLLLACAGGALSVAVGWAALRGLRALLPPDYLPVQGVPLDWRVLGFTLAASISTSVLFGLLPAMGARKVELRAFLGSRGVAGREGLRLREVLIVAEVAFTVVLLAASGLLIRTLIHFVTMPPGFDPHGVMTAKASLDEARYHDPAAFERLLENSVEAMRRIPSVANAAVGLSLPYERALNDGVTLRTGPKTGQMVMTGALYVTPGYFDTLRIPLLAGRAFNASDRRGGQLVAIVNRAFIQKFLGGMSAVGQVMDKEGTVLVGVVGDVTVAPRGEMVNDPLGSMPMLYFPATQANPAMLQVVHGWFQPSWIVRTAGPVEGLTGQMERAMASVDPALPFSGFYSMEDHRAEQLVMQRLEVALLGVMAGLALLLSAVGIFGLVASMVAQRTREIGIRMALGATLGQMMARMGGLAVRSPAAGLVLGLVLCAGVLRVMRGVIYGVSVYDPKSLTGVVLALGLVSLGAALLPTLRIARTDPVQTLREE